MEDVKGWATLLGAIVAGVVGAINLFFQIRGPKDRFRVVAGSTRDHGDPSVYMHVVSLSEHPIRLIDWGWIDSDLRLRSIPSELQEPDFWEASETRTGSEYLEKRTDLFEVGYQRRDTPVGAWAKSATERYPKLAFRYDAGFILKARVRLRVWWLGSAYLHY